MTMLCARIAFVLTLVFILLPTGAAAQDRFQVGLNVGAQAAAGGLTDRFEFDRFAETATSDVDYGTDPGLMFDGSIGVALYKALGAAVTISRFTRDGAARVAASIPHPFFDDRHRPIAGDHDGIARTETGIHAQVTYTLDPAGPLRVMFSGGPSFVTIEQEIVTGVRYSESYPFDEAAFTGADTRRASASGIGFNAGADLTWVLGRHVGVGGLVRFTRAPLDLDIDDRTIAVTPGGLTGAAGLRLMF
jgi:hypothetical protein